MFQLEHTSPGPRRPRASFAHRHLGALAASLVALLALAGCGTDDADSGSTDSHAQAAVSTTQPGQAGVTASQAGMTRGPSQTSGAISAPDSGEAPPPELELAGPDSVVTPGTAIEVTAEASPDAEQLVLWDGIGDHQAMTYDTDVKVWRASYRLPIRPRSDRVALSVTAYNGARRWRRRWVFVQVGDRAGTSTGAAGADSTR